MHIYHCTLLTPPHLLFFFVPLSIPISLFFKNKSAWGGEDVCLPKTVLLHLAGWYPVPSIFLSFFLKLLSKLALFFPVSSKSNYEAQSCQWSSRNQCCYFNMAQLCGPGILSRCAVTEHFGSLVEPVDLKQENTFNVESAQSYIVN